MLTRDSLELGLLAEKLTFQGVNALETLDSADPLAALASLPQAQMYLAAAQTLVDLALLQKQYEDDAGIKIPTIVEPDTIM